MNSRVDQGVTEELHRFPSGPYGLNHDLDTSWIDHFQVTSDGDVHYMWIGYSKTPRPAYSPREYILCGTLYRDPTIDDLALDSANLATLIMANLTLPEVQADSAFIKKLFEFVGDQAASHDTWDNASWLVDGEPVAAKQWSFAGGTAAFAIHDNEKAVLTVSEGIDVRSLTVNTMNDLGPYGINVTSGIRFSDLAKGPGSMMPVGTDFHADHERFR